jgi:hypothetical protein
MVSFRYFVLGCHTPRGQYPIAARPPGEELGKNCNLAEFLVKKKSNRAKYYELGGFTGSCCGGSCSTGGVAAADKDLKRNAVLAATPALGGA